MTAYKPTKQNADNTEQLALNIPGFDFTSPEADIPSKTSTRAQASNRPATAGQLRLKLDD